MIAWQGITVGAPVTALRERWGDPLFVTSAEDNPAFQVRRYWIAGSNATFVLVFSRRGYVEGVHIFTSADPAKVLENVAADPSGVRLGDTVDRVKSLHPDFTPLPRESGNPVLAGRAPRSGADVAYEFVNGRVRSFQWTVLTPAELPALAAAAEPLGRTFDTAILDEQASESDGVAWEYMYLAFHPCDDRTPWTLRDQALLHRDRQSYDRIHVICPTTKSERDFYFDVTSYFGKL